MFPKEPLITKTTFALFFSSHRDDSQKRDHFTRDQSEDEKKRKRERKAARDSRHLPLCRPLLLPSEVVVVDVSPEEEDEDDDAYLKRDIYIFYPIERERHYRDSMTMMMSRRLCAVGWSTTLKKALENTLLVVVVTRGSTNDTTITTTKATTRLAKAKLATTQTMMMMSFSSSSSAAHKDADGVDDFVLGAAFGKRHHRLRQYHPTTTREGRRWKKETERRGFAATPKTKEEEEERNATGHDFDDRILLERRRRQQQQQQTSSSSSSSIVNIPNSLSLARALSGPFISYMVVQGPDTYSTELVLTSIAVAGVSDYLDGYLARRWNQTSNFGSFFDAAADKIFVSSISVGMAVSGKLPAWMIGVFVFRDCGFLASGFWRRANALKFEKLTWRQYFAIDDVNREDERENKRTESGSSNSNESARVENSDWQAFNSTEKWEPLYVGKVATALQMGLLTVACGQTLDHIPLLFDTYEAQKHAASALVENFGYITFAATTYATAEYAKAYFSHPGWKERKQLRDERREERRERIRASVQDIQNSAKMKYASLKQTSKEKMERVDEMRRVKANTQSRQQRAPTASAD